MPVRGTRKAKQGVKRFTQERQNLAVKAANAIGFTIGSRADNYVPVDTKALMNSRYTLTDKTSFGTRVKVGYAQDYAIYLHGNDRYSPLWRPRPVGTLVYDQGKGQGARRKTAANMDATPQWLNRGASETKQQQLNIIKDIFKV